MSGFGQGREASVSGSGSGERQEEVDGLGRAGGATRGRRRRGLRDEGREKRRGEGGYYKGSAGKAGGRAGGRGTGNNEREEKRMRRRGEEAEAEEEEEEDRRFPHQPGQGSASGRGIGQGLGSLRRPGAHSNNWALPTTWLFADGRADWGHWHDHCDSTTYFTVQYWLLPTSSSWWTADWTAQSRHGSCSL